jgi:hypothetical protein
MCIGLLETCVHSSPVTPIDDAFLQMRNRDARGIVHGQFAVDAI